MKIIIKYICGVFLILFYCCVLAFSFFPNMTTAYSMVYVERSLKEYPNTEMNYQLGSTVKYQKEEYVYHNLSTDWHGVEKWGIWSAQRESSIYFFINSNDISKNENLFFATTIKSCASDNNVNIRINDTLSESFDIHNDPSECIIEIPSNVITDNSKQFKDNYIVKITFEAENYIVPSEVKDDSTDNRKLYIGLIEAMIYDEESDPNLPQNSAEILYNYGNRIIFSSAEENNGNSYRHSGWANPEIGFCWTNGEQADLYFRVDDPKDSTLSIDVGRTLCDSYDISINDTIIFDDLTVAESVVEIPVSKDLSSNVLHIVIKLNNPVRPCDIRSDSTDERLLGIQVKSIIIE